jgi:hypothetical protein
MGNARYSTYLQTYMEIQGKAYFSSSINQIASCRNTVGILQRNLDAAAKKSAEFTAKQKAPDARQANLQER